jgi:non-homologous end joining protein Ku
LPEKHHDEYAQAPMKVIEEKIAAGGKELPAPAHCGPPPSTKVVDIVAMLQESLKAYGKSEHAEPKRKARKRA